MSVTLNGHLYSASMFLGYGYQAINADTGLPNFPESIATDLLAQFGSSTLLLGIAPGAVAGRLRSNGAAWVRVSGVSITDLATGTLAADLLFTDATFDVGKSGATRPRDGFFSRNMVVGGTFQVVGASTFGAISALGTVSADLLFTDATYDVGKSAATRPRDGFFSRNVVIGGTLNVTGAITGNLTGNASTATTLQNSRNINNTAFNGSADIALPFASYGALYPTKGVNAPWWADRPYYSLSYLPETLFGNSTGTAGIIKYHPFYVGRDCTLDEIGMECTVAAAGEHARVGIYSPHATVYGPLTLMVDSGSLDLSTTGTKMTTGLSIALKAGVQYWAAFLKDNTVAGHRTCSTSGGGESAVINALGLPNAAITQNNSQCLAQTFPFAALPSTAAPSSLFTGVTAMPMVLGRFSA